MSSLSKFFDIVLFLLPSLVTGPSFHVSFRVSWFWCFNSFILYGIDKNQIDWIKCLLSEFCPISGDWDKSGIPNLEQMSLRKCSYMLQNARVTSFTVSELLRENQQMDGGGGIKSSHPHKLGLKSGVFKNFEKKNQCAQNYVFIFKYFQWTLSVYISFNSLFIKV